MRKKEKGFMLKTILVFMLVSSTLMPGIGGSIAESVGNAIPEGELVWTDNGDGTATITDYTGDGGADLVIPDTVDGLTVTGITRDGTDIGTGFEDKDLTGTIIIPDSVTTIGERAFRGNELTSIDITGSVTTIDERAFQSNELTSVVIPDSVTHIGSGAFRSNLLESITIPGSVTTIENSAFRYNQLTSVVILDGVTAIENYAFHSNELTSAAIPDSVTTIGRSAFEDNQLTSVAIPNSVTTIGRSAYENNQLTSIAIPDSVTTIGISAFEDNQITSVVIPNSVTTIKRSAFENNQITSVGIPNSVTDIENSAFRDNLLESITIPGDVTEIGSSAFRSNELTSVVILDGVRDIGNSAFQDNQITSVIIPDSITNIGSRVFRNNLLESVTIPESVTEIGNDAFRSNQITSVAIPDSVTTIGRSAFEDNQITSVYFGKGMTNIQNDAFRNNQLTSIVLPRSLNTLDQNILQNNSNLTEIVMLGDDISIGDNIVHADNDNFKIAYTDVGNGGPGRYTADTPDGDWKKVNLVAVFREINERILDLGFVDLEGGHVEKPANPERKGYVFAGWYEATDLHVLWDFNTEIADNRSIYAKFERDDLISLTWSIEGTDKKEVKTETNKTESVLVNVGAGEGLIEGNETVAVLFEVATADVDKIDSVMLGDGEADSFTEGDNTYYVLQEELLVEHDGGEQTIEFEITFKSATENDISANIFAVADPDLSDDSSITITPGGKFNLFGDEGNRFIDSGYGDATIDDLIAEVQTSHSSAELKIVDNSLNITTASEFDSAQGVTEGNVFDGHESLVQVVVKAEGGTIQTYEIKLD